MTDLLLDRSGDLQISADGKTYGWDNISILARQKAVTNESMVVVT